MIMPLVHLNGTGVDRLIEQVDAAHMAISAAIQALGEAAPNGRDYYPISDDAFEQARREHVARLTALAGVELDLIALGRHLHEQKDARTRQRRGL